jgi:hypothetical protein
MAAPNDDINQKFEDAEIPAPPFTPEYLEAFLCVCLAQLGGFVSIKMKSLKSYKVGGVQQPVWNEKAQAFVMANAGVDTEKIIKALNGEPVIKIARNMPKLSDN